MRAGRVTSDMTGWMNSTVVGSRRVLSDLGPYVSSAHLGSGLVCPCNRFNCERKGKTAWAVIWPAMYYWSLFPHSLSVHSLNPQRRPRPLELSWIRNVFDLNFQRPLVLCNGAFISSFSLRVAGRGSFPLPLSFSIHSTGNTGQHHTPRRAEPPASQWPPPVSHKHSHESTHIQYTHRLWERSHTFPDR